MAAPAMVDLRTQLGIESVAGTATPANILLPSVPFNITPEVTSEQFTGQGNKHNTASVVHMKMARGAFEGPVDFNALRYILDSLVGFASGQPTTPGGATNARQWLLDPQSQGPDSNAKTLTIEQGNPTPVAQIQRMTGCKVTSLTVNATQSSVRMSGNILCRFPTEGNYRTGNEIQTVTITGVPDGGTFTLTYSAQTTGNIAYNATAATVQTALEALSNIAVGDVSVTGGPGPGTPYVVEFKGTLANSNVAEMTADGTNLTGGTDPDADVATTQAGATITTIDERPVARGMIDVFIADSFSDLSGESGTFAKITDIYEETLTIQDKDDPFFVHNTTYDSYKETVEKQHAVTFSFRTAHNAQSQAFFNSIGDGVNKHILWRATGREIDAGVNTELIELTFTGDITALERDTGGIVHGYLYTFTGIFEGSFGGVWAALLVNELTA